MSSYPLSCFSIRSLKDQKSFETSDWARAQKAKYEADAAGPPLIVLFKVADFPKDAAPKAFTQFSRMEISDESKQADMKAAWEDLMVLL
jgi:hypothetical protein